MKRRQALKNIALISSGIALLPACSFDKAPVLNNFTLDAEQFKMLKWLTDTILPKGELEIVTPEATVDFILTMIDDCYDPKDIQKYLAGLDLFVQVIQEKYQTTFKKLHPEQSIQLFSEIQQAQSSPENLSYFLATTKKLTVQHFTTSEYFMTNYMDFEFVPGRYLGCVRI